MAVASILVARLDAGELLELGGVVWLDDFFGSSSTLVSFAAGNWFCRTDCFSNLTWGLWK